jgi:hypothetical protein
MILTIDTFSFVDNSGYNVTIIIQFDTDKKIFLTNQTSSGPQNSIFYVNELQRGKPQNQFISSSCIGFDNTLFYSSFNYPFAIFRQDINSASCGFVQTPIPPPPTPTTCDLVVTATATPQTDYNVNNGTIVATISQSIASTIQVNLYKKSTIDVIKSVVLSPTLRTYTFIGLAPNDYYLTAFDSVNSCVAPSFNISVLGIFFNDHYFFNFCEKFFDKRDIQIKIKTKNYSGAAIDIKTAGANTNILRIDYPGSSQYKFESIIGSGCDTEFMTFTEFQYADLLIAEERTHLMEAYISGVLFWTGYLTSDRSIEPFKSVPYPVKISAFDGVKLLSDIDFNQFNSEMTFLQAIKFCLDKTQISLPFKSMIDFHEKLTDDFYVISGFVTSAYGLSIQFTSGTYKFNGSILTIVGNTFTISALPSTEFKRTYYIYILVGGTISISPFVISNSILIAIINQYKDRIDIVQTPYITGDVLNDHKFQTNNFIKNDGTYTDCLTVLESIAKQFTAQIKQSNGYWVIENIGSKARGNTTETTYKNDLTFISQTLVNFSKDVSCDNIDGYVLGGGNLSLLPGDKKSIVKWNLGFPAPVINNGNFEQWIDDGGKLIPTFWQISKPYDYFNRGSKFDKIYDPTTGVLTTVENGTYFFNFKKDASNVSDSLKHFGEIQSPSIIVFNQEVINLSFQAIFTNRTLPVFSVVVGLFLRIGNFICVNYLKGVILNEAIWITDDGVSNYSIQLNCDETKFLPFGDQTNVNIVLPPAPAQGLFTVGINAKKSRTFIINVLRIGFTNSDLGFDNFKIVKTSPVTDAKILLETLITVNNKKRYSNVPKVFEVYFGDVESDLRTDGIRTVNGFKTLNWNRIGILELESINNIVAKELLSQYQDNFRIFEGEILGKAMNIRNIFNLPAYDLYKFVPLSFTLDVINCRASVKIAQIYAQDGSNSGAIGSGAGTGAGNQVPDGNFVIGWDDLSILSNNNNNIFKVS